MENCKFCKELTTGETNEDILGSELPVPGVSEYAVYIDNDHIEISATDFIGNTLLRDRVKINFCPFCGRKFDDVNEEKHVKKIGKGIFRRKEK